LLVSDEVILNRPSIAKIVLFYDFITQQEAIDKNINYESVYKLISLNVHSSLDAVGLTAAFSTKLAEKNISANVVAAYYHDHIFVPEEKAEQALAAISEFRLQSHPVRLK